MHLHLLFVSRICIGLGSRLGLRNGHVVVVRSAHNSTLDGGRGIHYKILERGCDLSGGRQAGKLAGQAFPSEYGLLYTVR